MKFVRASEVAEERPLAVFGHGRIGPSLAVLFVTAFSLGALWFAPRVLEDLIELPVGLEILAFPFAIVMGLAWVLICFGFVAAWRAAIRPSNWVMKVAYDGIWVNVRSYLNAHFDESVPTVAWIPWSSIAKATPYSECTTGGGSIEKAHTVQQWIDLELKDEDTTELARLCSTERTRPAPERKFLFVRSRTRFSDEPVTVPRSGIVRIQRVDKRMSAALAEHVQVANEVQAALDLDSADLDTTVRALCRRGERIAAVALVRRTRRLSLAEAREYVDSLEDPRAA